MVRQNPAANSATGTAALRPPLAVRRYLQTINWRAYTLVVVLLVIWVVFHFLTDGLFSSSRNMSNLLRQTSLVAILATGMVLVIVSGNIDLSAGSAVGLVAIVAAEAHIVYGLPVELTVLIAMLVGLAMGVWQGFWIAYMHVPSFVVTLGGLLAFRGIGLVITQGLTLSPFERSFANIGQGFVPPVVSLAIVIAAYILYLALAARRRLRHRSPAARGSVRLARGFLASVVALLIAFAFFGWVFVDYRGIPIPVLLVVVVGGVLAFVARKTRFGRHLYGIGGNREACRLSGINIARNTFLAFVLMGALYGLVGTLLAARLNAAPPNAGFFMELEAIAAAVIGGTSLMGGIGTIEGAVVGALLMQSIGNGMSLMNILTFYQMIVTGLLLILAVYIDIVTKRRRA